MTNNNSYNLILGGGLRTDYTKSKAVRIIDLANVAKIAEANLTVEDYFYDNQVLDLPTELMIVGYVNVWKVVKENGRCTVHDR